MSPLGGLVGLLVGGSLTLLINTPPHFNPDGPAKDKQRLEQFLKQCFVIETAHLLPQPFKTLTSLSSPLHYPPNTLPEKNLQISKRIFVCEIFAIDILTPTIDVEEDVPGHMTSVTPSNYSHVLLSLIFVLDLLLTYFVSINDHQNNGNLVRSFEQG